MRGPFFIIDNSDDSGPRNTANQRRILFPAQVAHLRNCQSQCISHFSGIEISIPEVKFPHLTSANRFALKIVIPVPLILREYYPRPLGNKRQPDLVVLATTEVASMTLELDVANRQGVHDRLAVVEVLIQVQDEIIKLQLLWFPIG